MGVLSLQSSSSTVNSSKLFNRLWIRDACTKQRIGATAFCSLRLGMAMLLPLQTIVAVIAGVVALAAAAGQTSAQSANTGPLQLETKIPLGEVRGRIDHMAVDFERDRLFVAELGNDSLGVIDLADRKLIWTIAGLKGPQSRGYEHSTDKLHVANAGDGSVRMLA